MITVASLEGAISHLDRVELTNLRKYPLALVHLCSIAQIPSACSNFPVAAGGTPLTCRNYHGCGTLKTRNYWRG